MSPHRCEHTHMHVSTHTCIHTYTHVDGMHTCECNTHAQIKQPHCVHKAAPCGAWRPRSCRPMMRFTSPSPSCHQMMIGPYTHTHARPHTCTCTPAHTQAGPCTGTHTRTPTPTHPHTHACTQVCTLKHADTNTRELVGKVHNSDPKYRF